MEDNATMESTKKEKEVGQNYSTPTIACVHVRLLFSKTMSHSNNTISKSATIFTPPDQIHQNYEVRLDHPIDNTSPLKFQPTSTSLQN